MKKLLMLCLLFTALPVLAQDYYPLHAYGLRKDTSRLELYGGMILPGNNWEVKPGSTTYELGSTGWTAGLGFTRNVVRFFGLGVDANYAQLGDGKKDTTGSYYRTGVATGLVTGRVSFFPSSATRPYIPVGFGIAHTFARHKTNGHHQTVDGTDLAEMIGLGLEFDLDDDMIFGVESRYYRIHMADEMRDAFKKNHFHHVLIMLKIGCRF